ncbi:helicase HerA-like domain-containing protein [Escherichia coli]
MTDWEPHANPVVVWDIFGEKGHPVRATVADLGPLLLARLLNLNEVQSGGAEYYLPHRRRSGPAVTGFKDLRAITQYIGDNAKSFQNQYRQYQYRLRRCHPARAADAGAARCRALLR